MTNRKQNSQMAGEEFVKQASSRSRGIFGEIFGFLVQNKKWWLLPIIIFLLLAGTLIILGGTSIAPLIYTIF
jgi:hypothetical protein